MQTSAKFFEKCSHLKFLFFPCPQNCSALIVGRGSAFIIRRPINFYLRAKVGRKPLQSPGHERKGHSRLPCSLNRQGKYCECYPAHSFQFIIIMGGFIGFYFINQPCALFIAFDKCFYMCDVVVLKSLYIVFL